MSEAPGDREAEREARLRLHLALLHRPLDLALVLEAFPAARRFWRVLEDPPSGNASEREFVRALSRRHRSRLLDARWGKAARGELDAAWRHGTRVLCAGDPGWPAGFARMAAAPGCLFVEGPEAFVAEISPDEELAVAIVGTRRPTPYGERQARRFAGELARRGVTIVSGLARGIDALAHRAALAAGGQTTAVLGSGLGRIYPLEHRELAAEISARAGSAVVSEFPRELPPRKYHFPRRNRLISALSRVVLVIEAGERSGTIHTVDWALEQGRTVCVLPGRVEDEEARGCLRLLQTGALPVVDPGDVLELLGEQRDVGSASATSGEGRESDRPAALPAELELLFREADAWTPDAIAARLARDPFALLVELDRLEASGALRRIDGGSYVRSWTRELGTGTRRAFRGRSP